MNLEELLNFKTPPKKDDLTNEDITGLFFKYKGLLKKLERDEAFWLATHENIRRAYSKLDKQAREIQESKQLFQTTLRGIGDAVISTDSEGKVFFMNPVAESITRWKMEEAISHPLLEVFNIINEITKKPVENPFDRIMRTGLVVGLANHTMLIAKDGREIPIADSGAPIKDKEGNIIGVVIVFRDVTKEREAEERLISLEKLAIVGQLAGGIAHDFNNILTSIIGATEIAIENVENEIVKEMLEIINRQGNMTASLISQILDFSRKAIIMPENINIRNFVKTFSEIINVSFTDNISIEYNIANLNIAIDPSQLQHLFLNVLFNSRDAMPSGGTINLNISKASFSEVKDFETKDIVKRDYVHFLFEDDGCGMNSEVLNRVFEPYFTTKPFGTGTGLGLAQVYGIVRQNKGYVNVESEVDKGTKVHIFFPTYEEEEEEEISKASGRILLVEDEEDCKKVIQYMLEDLGFEVHTASNGLEALNIYDSTFDLIIIDIVMPMMKGDHLINKIRKIDSHSKFIALTGYTDTELPKNVKILLKPITKLKLAKSILATLNE